LLVVEAVEEAVVPITVVEAVVPEV